MRFIPQVTCRRCKRRFSILRSRCPHCGARREDAPGRAQPSTEQVQEQRQRNANPNARWQMIFGTILLAAVIIAVIALISMSLNPPAPVEEPSPSPSFEPTPPPTPTPTPTPTPEPTPTVESITVAFAGKELTDFTLRTTWAPLQLTATVYPVSEEAVVRWRTTDESVITVSDNGLVTAVGNGIANLVVECGAIAKEYKVIVPS